MELATRRVHFAGCTPNPHESWMKQIARNLIDAVDGFLNGNPYLAHYHSERNHQGLPNRIIEPGEEVGRRFGEIASRERLGGMLRYYYRRAA